MDALLEEAEDGEDGYDAFDVSYEETRQTRDADLPTIGVSGAVNDDVFATPDGDQFISPVERKHYNSDEDNSRHGNVGHVLFVPGCCLSILTFACSILYIDFIRQS